MKRLAYLLLLLIIGTTTFAQVSVDHATGRGSINVPLGTVGEGAISIPLMLNYDASGVQVGKASDNVGLQWGLNTGNKIVRIVRDYPDESHTVIPATSNTYLSDEWNYLTNGAGHFASTPANWTVFRDNEPDLFVLYLNDQTYLFRLKPGTASDRLQRTPEVVFENQQSEIKVEPVMNRTAVLKNYDQASLTDRLAVTANHHMLLYFKVTDKNGLIHIFGETVNDREYQFTLDTYVETQGLRWDSRRGGDTDRTKESAALHSSVPFSWRISRIVYPKTTPDGEKHQEVTYVYSRKKTVNKEFPIPLDKNYTQGCEIPKQQTIIRKLNRIVVLEANLERIYGNEFKVEFNNQLTEPQNISAIIPDYKTGDFTDFEDKSLLKILPMSGNAYRNELNNINNRPLVKNVVFYDKDNKKTHGYYLSFDYFNSYSDKYIAEPVYVNIGIPFLGPGYRATGTFRETKDYRPRLKGVYPIYFNNESVRVEKGTEFTYEEGALPDGNSSAKDSWGYYNGADENEKKTGGLKPSSEYCAPRISVSDLEPNITHAKLGTITCVKNPTGAITTIEYELHQAENYFNGFIQDPSRPLTGDCNTPAGCNGYNIRAGLNKPVGGLRVRATETLDPVTQDKFRTEYSYVMPGSTATSGYLQFIPSDNILKIGLQGILSGDNVELRRITNIMLAPGYASQFNGRFISGNYILYEYVKEKSVSIKNNVSSSLGYKLYKFNILREVIYRNATGNAYLEGAYHVDETTIAQREPLTGVLYPRYMDSAPTFWVNRVTNGMLQSIKVYDKDDNLVSETSFDFSVEVVASNQLNAGFKSPILDPKINSNTTAFEIFEAALDIALIVASGGLAAPGVAAKWIIRATNPSQAVAVGVAVAGSAGDIAASSFAQQAGTAKQLTSGDVVSFAINIAQMIFMDDVFDLFAQWGWVTFEDKTNYQFDLRRYQTPAYSIKLNKKTSINYEGIGANAISTKSETVFTYGSTAHNEPTKVVNTVYAHNGSTLTTYETRSKYTFEFNSILPISSNPQLKGIRALKAKNILAPVEVVSIKDDKVIEAAYTAYSGDANTANSYAKPVSMSVLELESPIEVTAFQFMTVSATGDIVKSSYYQPRSKVMAYNDRGLPTQVTDAENPNLVASTTYDDKGFLPLTKSITTPSSTVYTTTYEYSSPLFGVSKVTNADGSSTKIEYDELGRQVAIKDHNNHLLKSYVYTTVPVPIPIRGASAKLLGFFQNGAVNSTSNRITLAEGMTVTKDQVDMLFAAGGSGAGSSRGPSASRRLALEIDWGGVSYFTYELVGANAPKTVYDQGGQAMSLGESSNARGFIPEAGPYKLTIKGYTDACASELKTIKTITFTVAQSIPTSINLDAELVAQTAPVGRVYSYSITPELFRPSSSTAANAAPAPPPIVAIIQQSLPSWLLGSGNTVSGTPPDSAVGKTFLVKAIITSATNETAVVEYPLRIVSACDAANPVWLEGKYVQAPLQLKASAVAESSSVFGATVMPGANLQVQAGQVVRLKPGFVVKPGGAFKAKIAGCP